MGYLTFRDWSLIKGGGGGAIQQEGGREVKPGTMWDSGRLAML